MLSGVSKEEPGVSLSLSFQLSRGLRVFALERGRKSWGRAKSVLNKKERESRPLRHGSPPRLNFSFLPQLFIHRRRTTIESCRPFGVAAAIPSYRLLTQEEETPPPHQLPSCNKHLVGTDERTDRRASFQSTPGNSDSPFSFVVCRSPRSSKAEDDVTTTGHTQTKVESGKPTRTRHEKRFRMRKRNKRGRGDPLTSLPPRPLMLLDSAAIHF